MNKHLPLLMPLMFVSGLIAGRLTAKPASDASVDQTTETAPAAVLAPVKSKREEYDAAVDDWNYYNPSKRRLRWADTDVSDVLSRIDKLGAEALNDPVMVDVKTANKRRESALTIIALAVAVLTTVLSVLLIVVFQDEQGAVTVALLMPPTWIAAMLLASSFRLGNKARWWLRVSLTIVGTAYCLVWVNFGLIGVVAAIASVFVAATFDWLAPLAPQWKKTTALPSAPN